MKLRLPAILDIPQKLLPMVTDFNSYRRILLTGGRGGGKTQAVARLILYISSQKKVRVVCGRETKTSIEESVYTTFVDLIDNYGLDYEVFSNKIIHKKTGSQINFKGFKETGRVNIKGLEGVDILWVDEAEAITKETLDILNPTIRKPNSVLIFTMNRGTVFDPVYIDNAQRDDCLHIHINYDENKYCPQELLKEALACKEKSISEYNHIWLGQPKPHGDFMVFNTATLWDAKKVSMLGFNSTVSKVLAIDIANGGGDLTVAGILEYKGPTRCELTAVETWDTRNLMETTGKIVELKKNYKPDVLVVDANGVGEGVYSRLLELGVDVFDFKGGRSSKKQEAYNTRAEAYLKTRDLIEKGYVKITDERVLKDLEVMSYELRSDNKKIIIPKHKIKKQIQRSPDFADMFSMAVWGLDKVELTNYDNLQYSYEI